MKKHNNMIIKVIILTVAMMLTTTSSALIYYESDSWNNGMPLGVKKFEKLNKKNYYMSEEFIEEIDEQNTNDNESNNREKQNLVIRQTSNQQAIIDYTYANNGYVSIQYTGCTEKRLKATVQKIDGIRYVYNITQQEWSILPISDGNGEYIINVYENVVDNKYMSILSEKIQVDIYDEANPFLVSNQYVDFRNAPETVKKAEELTRGLRTTAEKVSSIYNYVINNMTYDYEKAENVQPGYLPDLDEILRKQTGICLDYSALITGMLRSQNIPCKIVVGYAGKVYHAWISVYIEEKMTAVCGMRYYDKEHWLHMDPTYASGNQNGVQALEYINNGNNYSDMYFY